MTKQEMLLQHLKSVSGDFVFCVADFYSLFPAKSAQDIRVLLSRMVKSKKIARVTNGIFFLPEKFLDISSLLYKTAAKLRSRDFNYISLESVLSEEGLISQVMFNYLTIMTTGRSGIIRCGNYGTIEFVHTKKIIKNQNELSLNRYGMFQSSSKLALEDMKHTRRSLDLVNLS